MRKCILSVLFLSFSIFSIAQTNKFGFSFGCGYGTYNMSELKSEMLSEASSLPFDAQMVDNFPPTIYYYGFIEQNTDLGFSVGPLFSYYTTGGRIHYSDYSGEYYNNLILEAISIGMQVKVPIVDSKKHIPEIYGKLSTLFVKASERGARFIYDADELTWDESLNGGNTGFEFGFSYKIILVKHVYLGVFAGYEITNVTQLNNHSLNVEWSGLRTGIYLTITI